MTDQSTQPTGIAGAIDYNAGGGSVLPPCLAQTERGIVAKVTEERDLLEKAMMDTSSELGCECDNEEILNAIHSMKEENAELRRRIAEMEKTFLAILSIRNGYGIVEGSAVDFIYWLEGEWGKDKERLSAERAARERAEASCFQLEKWIQDVFAAVNPDDEHYPKALDAYVEFAKSEHHGQPLLDRLKALEAERDVLPADPEGCTVDVGLNAKGEHVWLRPEDVRKYIDAIVKRAEKSESERERLFCELEARVYDFKELNGRRIAVCGICECESTNEELIHSPSCPLWEE